MVPVLCTSLRQIRTLLPHPRRLLRPIGAPAKENAAEGYALIDHAPRRLAQAQPHTLQHQH